MTNPKKILLVSNAFYPEISPRSFRATELAKEFYRQGHKVVVYTKYRDFDYSDFLREYSIEFRMWERDRFHKVPQWKGKFGNLFSRGLSRLFLLFFEYPGIEDMFKVKNILKKESGYDLMISFAVPFPVHWGVAWAKTKKHRIANTWVADCGDPYMGNTNDTFKKMPWFAWFEKGFLKGADFITIPKIEMKANYYPEFHSKFREIPQGFDFSIKDTLPEYHPNIVPTFGFAGSFIKVHRDPVALLNYLSALNTDFKFVVFTKNTEFLEPYKEKLKEKLVINDYVPREILLKEMAGLDFLINIAFDPATQAPSKLIDYALSGRPVLQLASGMVDEKTLGEFMKGDYSGRMKTGDLQKYNIVNIARQFLTL